MCTSKMEAPEDIRVPVARLTNLMHSEVLQFFPPPSLPADFGGSLQGLSLYEGQGDDSSGSAASIGNQTLHQSIAELLRDTDISYL
jgi:hypothetical protein